MNPQGSSHSPMEETAPHALLYAEVRGYQVQERIGRGGFSTVFRAYKHEQNGYGQVAACKVVSLPDPKRSQNGKPAVDLKALQKEVSVHKSLKSKYILEYMDSLMVQHGHRDYIPGLYMLMELATHGDLFDKIAPDVGVDSELAKLYFTQLISGLEHIHSKGICHRDLKPENLLLGANGDLKISDFGLCAVWKHQGKTRLLTGRCGSLPYVAPELNSTGGYHAEPIDIWGAGVVLFTLLAGNTPWDEPSTASPEYKAYLTGELLQYDPWNNIPQDALALLLACLEVDPSKRITIPQIKTHRWLMSPSQISRQNIPFELTKGLRRAGMMDVAEPQRSQIPYRGQGGDAYASQLSQMDSQFMQATGLSSTLGGSTVMYNTLSRFRLAVPIEQTIQAVVQVLLELLGPDHVRESNAVVQVSLLDNRRQPLRGDVKFRDDPRWPGEVTLVELIRSKGDPLEWKRFWWKLVKAAGLREMIVKSDGTSLGS